MKYLNKVLAAVMIVLLPVSYTHASSSGRTGASQGIACNACHNGGVIPTVVLTGPSTVALGSTNTYTLTMSGGQQITGGLDVSASGGTLLATQPSTIVKNGELTQLRPFNADANGQITWTFNWQAPSVDADVVLYAAVLSSNGNFSTIGDAGATTTLTITVGAGGGGGQPVETGESLYIANCQTCHGAPPGPKAGRTAAQIQAAINANTGNMGSLSGLTAAQVQMIADFLGGQPQAPVAVPGGPYNGEVNIPVAFDGSGSTDPDGTIVSYDWDFGDGTTGTGATPTHTYVAQGNFTVTLTVTDNSGMTGSASITANIGLPPVIYDGVALYGTNCSGCHGPLATSTKRGRTAAQIQTAINNNTGTMGSLSGLLAEEVLAIADALSGISPIPVANPGGSYTGIINTAVQFDGSGSTDADGTIVSYDWDFGDGTFGIGVSPSHIYTVAGTYTVSLTVTDNSGNTNTATTTAIIGTDTQPPVLDGLALYAANCAGCHGAAPGTKAGRTAAQIQTAINGVASMSGLTGLSAAEVQAIADAISTGGGGGNPTDGKGLYDSFCASCHGPEGKGGTEEAVVGSSANSIQSAINGETAMQYLGSLLSAEEIAKIADYLNGGSGGGGGDTITVTKKSQYDAYCAACHGPEGRGGTEEGVRGASTSKIKSAISGERAMNYLSTLSDQIVGAISDYLNGDNTGTIEIPAPPTGGGGTPEGQALYAANCAGCHGAAPGTKAGRTAAQIQAAINGVSAMSGLSGLTAAEVQLIADAIAPTGGGGGGGGSTDGTALYNSNCAGCHGTAPGTKAGRTAAQIQAAINSVSAMSGLTGLTAAEVQAIADAINTGVVVPTDGKGLYDAYCASCHGAEGRGGTEEGVRGASARSIRSAISEKRAMRYLGSLLDSTQIDKIANYLNGSSGSEYTRSRDDD